MAPVRVRCHFWQKWHPVPTRYPQVPPFGKKWHLTLTGATFGKSGAHHTPRCHSRGTCLPLCRLDPAAVAVGIATSPLIERVAGHINVSFDAWTASRSADSKNTNVALLISSTISAA